MKPFYGTPPADWGTPPSSSDTVPQHDNSQFNDGPPEETAGGDSQIQMMVLMQSINSRITKTTTRRSTLRFQYRLGHNDVPVPTVVGRRSSKTSSLQLVGAIIVVELLVSVVPSQTTIVANATVDSSVTARETSPMIEKASTVANISDWMFYLFLFTRHSLV